MLLKSLEIRGFKSFADPVILEFEPGITVIVGPNGSGKSNIVDAICWVLGTQATSTLRTSSMQDVIFAGSPMRKPLGRAKVVLTFDNSDRRLPIDMSEVAISRTLHRDGESEYAINGSPCRLLDIQELLSDTGVGRQLHSIVGQGQLDSILSASPQDRRAMIEEAAGVLKYKRRKERAVRRLQATEENLARVQDLVREIQRRLRPLQKQVSAAKRYREVAERLKAVKAELMRRKLSDAESDLQKWEELRRQAEQRRNACKRAIEELSQKAERTRERYSEIATLVERATALVSRIDAVRRKCGAIGDLARERKRFFETVARKSSAMHLDLLGSDLAQVQSRISELELELPLLARQLQEAMEEEARLQGTVESLRERLVGGQQALEAAELAGERSSLESSLARAEIEASQLVERKRAAEEALGRLQAERRKLVEEIQRLDAQAGPLSEAVVRLEQEKNLLTEEIQNLEKSRKEAETELSLWGGRLEALKELSAQIAGIEGPERILESKTPKVLGGLWELIRVERGLEPAVEAALGELQRAVIVEDSEAALWCASVLQSEEGEGSAWVVDLERVSAEGRHFKAWVLGGPVSSTPPPALCRSILEFVGIRAEELEGTRAEKLRELLEVLLCRTYLANTLEEALGLSAEYPTLKFVTPTGAVVGPGVLKVGKPAEGPLRHLASLSEVAANARDADNRLRGIARTLAERTERMRRVEAELETARQALAECDSLVTSAAAELSRLDPEIDRLKAELAALDDAEAALVERIRNDRARLQQIEQYLGELRQASDEGQTSDAEEVARLANAEAALAAVREQRREAEKALAAAEERHSVLVSRKTQLEKSLEEERKRLHREDMQRTKALELAERAKAIEETVASELASVSKLEKAAHELAGSLQASAASLRKPLSDIERRIVSARAEAEQADETERRAGLEVVRAQTLLEQVESEARTAGFDMEELRSKATREARERAEDSGLGEGSREAQGMAAARGLAESDDGSKEADATASDADLEEADRETLEAELAALERDLQRMGPINQLALQEYEETSQRLRFVTSQAEDLEASKRELQKVIMAVEDQMLQVFLRALADVSRSYEEMLDLLFPGGTGRVYLDDPNSPLEAGVEVEAKPPGKAVKRMSLLSGGERSLVALAFLFAIYSARPSPFYVLDEVEAALDDVNLERFSRLVSRFRDHSQLVIITHQKRTVEVADALYGVSMQSDGVSKVVSYKVAESLAFS